MSSATSTADAQPAARHTRVLEVRDLSVTFRTETGTVAAADGVDLDLGSGEIVGVVGESGCGKSVTAMALSGLLPRSATVTGSVRLRDDELVGASPATLRRVRGKDIAYIFQEPMTSLNPVLTVGRQIAGHVRAGRHRAHAARRSPRPRMTSDGGATPIAGRLRVRRGEKRVSSGSAR